MRAKYGLECVSYRCLRIKLSGMLNFIKKGSATIGDILLKVIGGKNVRVYCSKKKRLKCYGCRQQDLLWWKLRTECVVRWIPLNSINDTPLKS